MSIGHLVSQIQSDLSLTLDKCLTHYDNYSIIGDLNYDLLSDTKSKVLVNFMELFNLSNLINEPTCFKKNCVPSLLDVLLTNSKNLCMRTLNFSTGVSDCHNMISTVINNTTPNIGKTKSTFRNFDNAAFLEEIANIQLQNLNTHSSDQVNNVYNKFENDFLDIIDRHAPMKTVYKKKDQLLYMNRELRKAIYSKKMHHNKYQKNKILKIGNYTENQEIL